LRKAVRSIGDRSTDVASGLVQRARKVFPDLAPEHTTILPSGVAVGTKDWCRVYECIGRRCQRCGGHSPTPMREPVGFQSIPRLSRSPIVTQNRLAYEGATPQHRSFLFPRTTSPASARGSMSAPVARSVSSPQSSDASAVRGKPDVRQTWRGTTASSRRRMLAVLLL
jgi:hypothetical protein